jgi:very-short-patch-repair endonuclease
MNDHKKEYLLKIFSRTNRKDTENYVLTGIWHRLNNFNIKPVTQQYVKTDEGRYALLDLFFPAINFAIEVDEPHHRNQREQDEVRMEDVLTALVSDDWRNCNHSTTSDLVFRITTYEKSIEEIDEQISRAVELIKAKIAAMGNKLEWLTYEEELERIKAQETFSIHTNFGFRYIRDIANTIFGKNRLSHYQNCHIEKIDKDNKLNLYCPKLAILKAGEKIAPAKGWLNELSDDWSTISQSNKDKDRDKLLAEFKKEKESGTLRATFAQYRDHLGFIRYRFVGVFEYDSFENKNGIDIFYHRRVQDEVKIVHPNKN